MLTIDLRPSPWLLTPKTKVYVTNPKVTRTDIAKVAN